MKTRLLLFMFIISVSANAWTQSITINESAGWLESAYVKWQPVTGATSYNVYYSGNGLTDQKIDNQLIRSYGTYFRADVLGLAAGNYTLKIAPVISGVEKTATSTGSITVLAHDRTGFAFDGGRVPGAYKADGTPKDGAVILYITENTKNTISLNVTNANSNPCVGLEAIMEGFGKGKDTRPLIVRLIGNITDFTTMADGDILIENNQNTSCYITAEGVGDDAVCNGWSFRVKDATNVEIRNLAAMNCNSTAGDDFGLQQDNDHVWVHNCDMFYGDAGSDADQIKGDGALDCKGSTYCTFSYNHFHDNGKSSLLGLSENTTTGLYVTYHHNWFDHSDSRHPRVRFYSVHFYNNYLDGIAKYGCGSTDGSSLFVEGNYFRNCKHPMMTSMQGTDIWDESHQIKDLTFGTFSNEDGGTIKSYNNTFDASIGTNNMRFVAYGDPNPAFNIAGVISSTSDFDAYAALTRNEQVPASVKSLQGANIYNNFDTDASLYVKNLVIDDPAAAVAKDTTYAGRIKGGDFKWYFNNAVDDASYLVNTALKAAITNYTTKLVYIQGEGSQTLTSPTNINQTVASGTAISTIVFTWGGASTDASVTGLPASGISFVKDVVSQTITISGTPTATIAYSIVTSGTAGTPATASGTITVSLPSSQTLTSTTNNNQTVTSGSAISTIIFTWGGDATDATVTGLPASGISFVKDAMAKTITISGTPTATLTYTITTSGIVGTPTSGSGTITVSSNNAGDMIQNFTLSGKTSTFYTITGNLSTSYGSATYAGLTLTQCLKMESTTNIAFTTTDAGTLTLVFGSSYSGSVSVDVTTYPPTTGIVTVSLPAGSNTVKKVGTNYLFYMSVVYNNNNPTPPTITATAPAARCNAGTVTLGATASDGTINWYAAATGGSSLGTGLSFTTPGISTTTSYFVDATANSLTTSARTEIVATINTSPAITTTTPAARCDAGTVTLGASASTGTINWYSAAIGGASLGTGTSFTTPSITATTSYFTDATSNSCTTGTRSQIVATINNTPTITATTPAARNDAGIVTISANASAGTVNWYAAATGGASLGTGANFTTPIISATTSYFVDATANNCTSTRSEIVATVNTSPGTLVQNASTITFSLFPNPVTENLTIVSDARIERVEIYNLTGILVKSAGDNIKTIDMSKLSQGAYLVRVFTLHGVFKSIVIKK